MRDEKLSIPGCPLRLVNSPNWSTILPVKMKPMTSSPPLLFLLALFAFLAVSGMVACNPVSASSENQPPTAVPTHAPPTATSTQLPTATLAPPPTPTAAPTAVPTLVPTSSPPQFTNIRDDAWAQTAVTYNAEFFLPDPANTGLWQFAANTFIHPLALVAHQETAYLLDGGRVLALNLAQLAPPEQLLAPGDVVDGVTVIEPLDIYAATDGLLALDRAGDVYRRDWASQTWTLERDDRPIRDTSSHYYVALDGLDNGRYLLETSYKYVMQVVDGVQQSLWMLPEARAVDVAAASSPAAAENVYVLLQEMDTQAGSLHLYRDTASVPTFRPPDMISQPRQVVAADTAVYVLDSDGRRLLVLSPDSGQLRQLWQLPAEVSAMALTEAGHLLFAGRDRLYFADRPEQLAAITGGAPLPNPQPHDPAFLAGIRGFVSPIGPNISTRDLQMPGAPRHYRLGVHQGADFYWSVGSPVYAAAAGTVIRAMHDYVPPFPAEFFNWQAEAQQLGYTSEAGLDFYRGRQVWIQHDNGLVSRYVHLSSIDYGIQEGQPVAQGQLIGAVGNSGSPSSLESEDSDAHLHFELWLGDHYIGQFLRPVEARDWFERILLGR